VSRAELRGAQPQHKPASVDDCQRGKAARDRHRALAHGGPQSVYGQPVVRRSLAIALSVALVFTSGASASLPAPHAYYLLHGKGAVVLLHISRDRRQVISTSRVIVDAQCAGAARGYLGFDWTVAPPTQQLDAFGHMAYHHVDRSDPARPSALSLELWFTGSRTVRGWLWYWESNLPPSAFCKADAVRLSGRTVRRPPFVLVAPPIPAL
jgi:hypothetical protein